MKSRYPAIAAVALGWLLAVAPAAHAAENAPAPKQLEQMAKDARTASEHSDVAAKYRDRAMSLESKAQKLEREARVQDAGPTRAMEQKWPAMIVNARERKAQLAVQARRAAQESYAIAERHEKLARQGGERTASVPRD
jgi:hypothetical protein